MPWGSPANLPPGVTDAMIDGGTWDEDDEPLDDDDGPDPDNAYESWRDD